MVLRAKRHLKIVLNVQFETVLLCFCFCFVFVCFVWFLGFVFVLFIYLFIVFLLIYLFIYLFIYFATHEGQTSFEWDMVTVGIELSSCTTMTNYEYYDTKIKLFLTFIKLLGIGNKVLDSPYLAVFILSWVVNILYTKIIDLVAQNVAPNCHRWRQSSVC